MSNTYQIIFENEPQKALRKIPKHDQIKIIEKIEGLSKNPKPVGYKTLKGSLSNYYRIRSGDYRIVYDIIEEKIVILILKIAHRSSVYG